MTEPRDQPTPVVKADVDAMVNAARHAAKGAANHFGVPVQGTLVVVIHGLLEPLVSDDSMRMVGRIFGRSCIPLERFSFALLERAAQELTAAMMVDESEALLDEYRKRDT